MVNVNAADQEPADLPWVVRTAPRRWLGWWGDLLPIGLLCLVIAGANLAADGLTLAAVAPLIWLATFIWMKVQARNAYRRGWRHGYESLARSVLQRARGETPDVAVRATVNGDPTPEPWDVHLPAAPRRMR